VARQPAGVSESVWTSAAPRNRPSATSRAVGREAQRLRDEEGRYRTINERHRRFFSAMNVPPGSVGVAAPTPAEVHDGLAPYQSALDLPIVRVLANPDVSSMFGVADAAAPSERG
jgi:hypothetical protein